MLEFIPRTNREMIMARVNRRRFLAASAAAVGTLAALAAARAADQPNERIRLAVMGVRGRGRGLLNGFAAMNDVEIAYVCDPDDNVVPAALKAVAARQRQQPQVER